jgi:hypothetical protein
MRMTELVFPTIWAIPRSVPPGSFTVSFIRIRTGFAETTV